MMQVTLFIISSIIFAFYASSYANSTDEKVKSTPVYCLISQAAFLIPLLVQASCFFIQGLFWDLLANILCAGSFVTLMHRQSGFGFKKWNSKFFRMLVMAAVVYTFVISTLISNPVYLNAFTTIFILSLSIHYQERLELVSQRKTIDSLTSQLQSQKSKKRNEVNFYKKSS